MNIIIPESKNDGVYNAEKMRCLGLRFWYNINKKDVNVNKFKYDKIIAVKVYHLLNIILWQNKMSMQFTFLQHNSI